MKKIFLLITCFLYSSFLFGQMTVVKGKVTAFNKYPLKNITVQAKKSKAKVSTNEYGVFELVCEPKDIISFESKSFIPVRRKIKDPADSIFVNLVFKDTPKSKEYAVGYGIMKEEDLTYAVSNMSQENNNFQSYSTIYELIVGRFPGVDVQGNEIIIRGISSINGSNAALMVVDGMAVNDITGISPGMVKSIDILKGSAAAIYGSRGANGVVLITLKK